MRTKADLNEELLAYWPFDIITNNVTPDIIGTNHLEAHRLGDTNLVTGKFGTAISLDGASQFLSLTYERSPFLPAYSMTEFTIAVWVRGPAKQINKILFAEGARENRSPLFLFGTHREGKDGSLNVFVRNSGAILNNIPTAGTVFDDAWHHVAWVNIGNSAKVYIDGVQNTEYRYERPQLALNYLSIGALHRDPAVYFLKAELDELAIWGRALTKREIQQLVSGAIKPSVQVTAR